MSTPTITLHWLESSRAQRIAWLLEELDLPYNLKLYKRNESNRADESLKQVFPTGKSPVIEVDYNDGKPATTIAESGHIVNYLVKKFDKTGKFKPVDETGEDELDFWTHFAEASVQPFLTFVLVLETAYAKAPYLMKGVISKYNAAIKESYSLEEVKKAFSLLEDKLTENSKTADDGSLFFVQNKISGADIMLQFSVSLAYKTDRLAGFDGSDYPALKKWLEQVESRPAFKNAIKKVETEGKGKFKVAF